MEWLQSKANKRVLIIAGAVVLVLLLVLLIRPGEELMNTPEINAIEARGVLRVGVRTNLPGLSDGEDGLEIRLAKLLAERIFPEADPESALELVEVSSRSAGAHLSNDDVDIVIAAQAKGASSGYSYSSAYYTDGLVFLCLPGNENMDYRTANVGTVQQSIASTRFKNFVINEKLADNQTNFASYPDLLTALRAGRIDLALVQGIYTKKYESEGFAVLPKPFGTVDYAAACSTDSPALVQVFDILLGDLRADGELSSMAAEYGLAKYGE